MPWIKCLGGGGGKARRGKPLSVSQPIHLLVKSEFEPQCHVFRTKQLRKPRPCHLCHQAVIKQASCCRVCKYICHKTCEDKCTFTIRQRLLGNFVTEWIPGELLPVHEEPLRTVHGFWFVLPGTQTNLLCATSTSNKTLLNERSRRIEPIHRRNFSSDEYQRRIRVWFHETGSDQRRRTAS